MTDLPMLAANDLAALIRTRAVSCREVMTACLDRIDRLNPAVNAIVSRLGRGDLLRQAEAMDAAPYSGWMHGFPHAVKDFSHVRGMPTTFGSPILANAVSDADAIFVERLRAAGAILIGRTNVPEFGMGSHTYNTVFGTTRNPYDLSKSAGGSSGGAAAALALRMVPVADGSDFGGSLRNPAGWNNVFGFRPSPGRVPFGPTPELFMQQLGIEGAMARTVTDLAMLLSVMAGYDSRAPLSLTADPAVFAQPLQRDMRGVRIGWLGDLGGIPTAPGMLDMCLGALRRLEAAGCIVEPTSLSIGREAMWDTFVTIRHGLNAAALAGFYHDKRTRDLLKPETRWEIEGGLRLSAVDLLAASAQRSAVYQAWRTLFDSFDFLALPSAQVFPFDAGLHWPAEIAGIAMDSYHRWMEIVVGPTLAGLPSLAVPAGFGPDGLPGGLQLIGPSQQDFAVLQLAYAYEQTRPPWLSVLPAAAAVSGTVSSGAREH